jgi:hypothetical protein
VRDRAVRVAQSELRFDREASLWSHAALILEWPDGAGPGDVVGAEVSLDPSDSREQLPERNGVTLFRLSRYLDRTRYPHLAFATFGVPAADEKASTVTAAQATAAITELKSKIRDAALEPNRERLRYPFWDWIGPWSRWVFTPHDGPSPLSQGIAHPGAAFCECAFEAARFDLTPGATAPSTCPEVLWATAIHWHDKIGEIGQLPVKVQVWSAIDRDEVLTRPVQTNSLASEFAAATGGATVSPPSTPSGGGKTRKSKRKPRA